MNAERFRVSGLVSIFIIGPYRTGEDTTEFLAPGLLSISPEYRNPCDGGQEHHDVARSRSNERKGNAPMSDQQNPAGMAALSICEALLLAMNDRNLLPEPEIVGVLRDAAATHENAIGSEVDQETHAAAANLINEIIVGGNLSRRS